MFRKIKPIRNMKYRDFVGKLPCSVPDCNHKSYAHHEQQEGQGTMGGKCCDSRMVPLCLWHHRDRHDIGRLFWWQMRVEAEELIKNTQRRWIEAGNKVFW